MEENPKSPRKWWYTWETLSHSPNLRLFLFDSTTNPRLQCKRLNVQLVLPQSQLLVTWMDGEAKDEAEGRDEASLRVPVPRALIDAESPVNFRALEDHIEVKLVLLLPVDHPVVSGFDSVYNFSRNGENSMLDLSSPLVMDSDMKTLSSMEDVHLYCRNCSTRLTRNCLRNFSEMPSANWRESADNWFGNCCCSFGGASEKIVAKYASSYKCSKGSCLLNATTVLLSQDDLEVSILSEIHGTQEGELEPSLTLIGDLRNIELNFRRNQGHGDSLEKQDEGKHVSVCGQVEDTLSMEKADNGEMDHSRDKVLVPECCVHVSESFQVDPKITNVTQLAADKELLLNGFLEDVFMARASNLSGNIKWVEVVCSKCSSLLGAYPSGGNNAPIDGGVRLFKCYISALSLRGGSPDVFRKYSLERMFINQLLEYARDELSFRVVVRDLMTKSPLFQVIILNPDSWCSTGLCSTRDESIEPGYRRELQPVVKVLFSDYSSVPESQLSLLVKKNLVDEIFILKRQGEELMKLLAIAGKYLPHSCACLQGSLVSSMQR